MNYYHIWVDLLDPHKDLDFCRSVDAYMGYLKQEGKIEGWTISRRKLGFGPSNLGEFHIVISVKDLTQLELAFGVVATRSGEVERLHADVYRSVTNFTSALYRDFPDPERKK